MGQQRLKIMDLKRFLPSGRATCEPTLPKMVKTRRKTKTVLWGFFGPMEALCGSREGPTGVFTAVVPHTSLHWITGAGEPWLRLSSPSHSPTVITIGNFLWIPSGGIFTLVLARLCSAESYSVYLMNRGQGSPPCAPKSDWALSERLNSAFLLFDVQNDPWLGAERDSLPLLPGKLLLSACFLLPLSCCLILLLPLRPSAQDWAACRAESSWCQRWGCIGGGFGTWQEKTNTNKGKTNTDEVQPVWFWFNWIINMMKKKQGVWSTYW